MSIKVDFRNLCRYSEADLHQSLQNLVIKTEGFSSQKIEINELSKLIAGASVFLLLFLATKNSLQKLQG